MNELAQMLRAAAEDRRSAMREAAAIARRVASDLGEPAIGDAVTKAILATIDQSK